MNPKRKRVILLAAAAVLVTQIGLSQFLDRQEYLPEVPPLSLLPLQVDDYRLVEEIEVEESIVARLGPDDILNRMYRAPGRPDLNLFVSYYRTQHRAKNAHDPKVCLPGSGWNPTASRTFELTPPGSPVPVTANYYVIARGGNKAVVVYWFQTQRGGYAVEQTLKIARVFQTIVDKRTDMSLVRVVVPVLDGDEAKAGQQAIAFARGIYPSVLSYFQ